MTISIKMTNAKGVRVNDVQIFEKEVTERKDGQGPLRRGLVTT